MKDINTIIEEFKNREVKAKEVFYIEEIDKALAYDFVAKYHYLGLAKFFAAHSYGLFVKESGILVGVATYSLPQGISATMGWFGLEANDASILELSRLCLLPTLNGTNATSFLLGNSIKMLKKYNVRAVITLADASRHIGSIYQVCNFKYYGVADGKVDIYLADGRKNVRGRSSLMHGIYLPRNKKHRYAYIIDPTLKCKYTEQTPPKDTKARLHAVCCDDKLVVHDARYDEYFTCPKCTSKFTQITKEEYEDVMTKSKSMPVDKLHDYVESIISGHIKDEHILSKFTWDI